MKIEVDISKVPPEDEGDVVAIVKGFTTSLMYFNGVTYRVSVGGEVIEADSLGRNE